jgi:hypothetical protein
METILPWYQLSYYKYQLAWKPLYHDISYPVLSYYAWLLFCHDMNYPVMNTNFRTMNATYYEFI